MVAACCLYMHMSHMRSVGMRRERKSDLQIQGTYTRSLGILALILHVMAHVEMQCPYKLATVLVSV